MWWNPPSTGVGLRNAIGGWHSHFKAKATECRVNIGLGNGVAEFHDASSPVWAPAAGQRVHGTGRGADARTSDDHLTHSKSVGLPNHKGASQVRRES